MVVHPVKRLIVILGLLNTGYVAFDARRRMILSSILGLLRASAPPGSAHGANCAAEHRFPGQQAKKAAFLAFGVAGLLFPVALCFRASMGSVSEGSAAWNLTFGP